MAYFPKSGLVNDFGVPNFLRQGSFDELATFSLQNNPPAGWTRYVDGRFNSVTVNTTAETLGATGIGTALPNGTPVRISASVVPGGLSANTTYYVVGAAADSIQLATSVGGTAINITSTGTAVNVWPMQPLDGTGGTSAGIQNAIISTDALRGRVNWQIGAGAVTTGGGGYSTDFTLPPADRGTVNSISFVFRAGSAYSVGQLEVFVIADPTGTPFLIVPSVIDIPGGSGLFQATFLSTSASTYRLCIHATDDIASTTNWTLDLDDIRIEPRVTVQGAAISDWQSYTPTWKGITADPTLGTVLLNSGRWRRVGDSMEIDVSYQQSTAGTAGNGGYYTPLPPGYAVDDSKITAAGSGGSNGAMGVGSTSAGTGVPNVGVVRVYSGSAENGLFLDMDGLGEFTSGSATNFVTTNLRIGIRAVVPIVGWSSNITLANSFTEFAFNTNTADATDTTSFGYGAAGVNFGAFAPTVSRQKRIRFQTPIQPSDVIQMEVLMDNVWQPVNSLMTSSAGTDIVMPFTKQGTVTYGAHVRPVAGSTTDVDVIFGQTRVVSSATYTGAGLAWSGVTSFRWRVRKSAGQNPGESLRRLVLSAHRNNVNQTGLNPNNSAVQIIFNNQSPVETRGFAGLPGWSTTDGSFTAPYTGLYRYKHSLNIGSTNVLNARYRSEVRIGATFAGGTRIIVGGDVVATAATAFFLNTDATLYLNAGDKLWPALFGVGNNSVSTLTLDGGPPLSWIEIEYIGPA